MSLELRLVKTATDAAAAARLAREAQWLRELQDVDDLEGQLPRLLEEGTDAGGRPYLVLGVPEASGEAPRAFTSGHARFLAALGKARFRSADFEISGTGEWLQRSLRELAERRPAQNLTVLEDAYYDCESALLYWTGPYVLSQGDFAPWNIRTFGSQLFVFDWGFARADASPLDDVLHYLMVQRLGQGDNIPRLRRAMQRAQEFALNAYPEWSWRPQVIGALTLVHLLGVILQRSLSPRVQEQADPAVDAYWKLLEKRSAWMPAANRKEI